MSKVLAALLVVLSSASARAQASLPAGEPPDESGLVAQQVVLGTLSGILAGVGGTMLGGVDSSRSPTATAAVGIALTATATFPGLAACALGQSSRWYDGSCASPVIGAFLGTLLVGVPMGELATHVTDRNTGDVSGPLVLTAFVATALAAGVGATLGWHLSKHRRQSRAAARTASAAAPPSRLSWPEMPVQRLAPGPVTFTAPVLAFTF
jgi:hypothetical protein